MGLATVGRAIPEFGATIDGENHERNRDENNSHNRERPQRLTDNQQCERRGNDRFDKRESGHTARAKML